MKSKEEGFFKCSVKTPSELEDFWLNSDHQRQDTDDNEYHCQWTGGTSKDCTEYLVKGNRSLAKEAQALSNKIRRKIQFNIGKQSQITRGNYGGCVNVPAAIVNHPRAFYRRQLVSKKGLRIYIGCNASAGFTAEQLKNAIVAFVSYTMYLTTRYNVELYLTWSVTSGEHTYIQVCPIGISPFDWSQVLGISHSNVFRRAIFSWRRRDGNHIYIRGHGLGMPVTDLRKQAGDFLNIRKEDIVLNGMLLQHSDPETWVMKEIEKMEKEQTV